MKTLAGSLIVGICVFWAGGRPAAAQVAPGEPLPVVEVFACNFVGGNDLEDLLAVANRWNDWADDQGVTDYTALVLTPYLFSDALTWDVGWLGAYPNGTAMGIGTANWLAEGSDLNADFEEVVDCAQHAQFASIAVHVPEGPPPAEGGFVGFRDCRLLDERIAQNAIAAHTGWTNYLAENGHEGFDAMLFPIGGERPDSTYSYKSVHGFPSIEAYGEFIDIITANVQVPTNIFGPVVSCDSSRLYAVTRIRAAEPEEE